MIKSIHQLINTLRRLYTKQYKKQCKAHQSTQNTVYYNILVNTLHEHRKHIMQTLQQLYTNLVRTLQRPVKANKNIANNH